MESQKNRCVLIGAMECRAELSLIAEDDYVILLDGGYRNKDAVKADLILGDFDSLGYIPEEENVLTYPVQKDDTDMMLAVKVGIQKGFHDFLLLGGIGGRLDHTIANIQTLAYLKSLGKRAMMVGDGQQIVLLKNETYVLKPQKQGIVSVFAYGGKARGVTISGLLYEVTDATITPEFPLGVSNHYRANEEDDKNTWPSITVEDGMLLLITTNKEEF